MDEEYLKRVVEDYKRMNETAKARFKKNLAEIVLPTPSPPVESAADIAQEVLNKISALEHI